MGIQLSLAKQNIFIENLVTLLVTKTTQAHVFLIISYQFKTLSLMEPDVLSPYSLTHFAGA
jgi:hypothetical protein